MTQGFVKLKLWHNLKTPTVTKLKKIIISDKIWKLNCDKTQNSNCEKIQKLKFWQNLKTKNNCDKTKKKTILTKLKKKSNCD